MGVTIDNISQPNPNIRLVRIDWVPKLLGKIMLITGAKSDGLNKGFLGGMILSPSILKGRNGEEQEEARQ